MSPDERNKVPQIKDYFIDCGMSKKEVDKVIEVGDFVTRHSPLMELGDCVNVKSLDNRAPVFMLLEALRELKKSKRKNLPTTFTRCSRSKRKSGSAGRRHPPSKCNRISALGWTPPSPTTSQDQRHRNAALPSRRRGHQANGFLSHLRLPHD